MICPEIELNKKIFPLLRPEAITVPCGLKAIELMEESFSEKVLTTCLVLISQT